jgi:hypothetical protein
VSYTTLAARTTHTRVSATGEGRRKLVTEFTSLLSKRVLGDSANSSAEALLELLDVLLIGRWDLVDLVWSMSVYRSQAISGCHTFGQVRHLVLAHLLKGRSLECALCLGINTEEVQVCGGQGQDASKDCEDLRSRHGEDRRMMFTLGLGR